MDLYKEFISGNPKKVGYWVQARPKIVVVGCRCMSYYTAPLLGGSGDLVSMVISTLSGIISNYKYSYLTYNPSY